jgi:small subunit ribosomal protein S20
MLPKKSKSVLKTARAAERKRLRNKAVRTATKTWVTKAEKAIAAGDLETAGVLVVRAISALDKAAEKGVIHPNNAARHKARLMKKFNQANPAIAGGKKK